MNTCQFCHGLVLPDNYVGDVVGRVCFCGSRGLHGMWIGPYTIPPTERPKPIKLITEDDVRRIVREELLKLEHPASVVCDAYVEERMCPAAQITRKGTEMSNIEWVLVPREPTKQMLFEGMEYFRGCNTVWKIMIDAAPAAPKAEPVGVFECDHDMWIHVADEHANRAGVVPLYLRPDPEVQRLRDALDSIRQYGSDTLSGRTDGPDDHKWQRDAVLEMTRRACRALKGGE